MPRRKAGADERPSMHSVAAYAGVSIATVSKVMQGVPTVLPANVKAVQNAIEALGYRINPLAAELRRGKRKLIGAILPNFDSTFGELAQALELEVEKRGYELAVTSSHASERREAELVARMQDWRVAGIAVVPVRNEDGGAALLLKDSGLPAVFIDHVHGNRGFDTVSIDYEQTAQTIAKRYTELGHTRFLIPHRARRDKSIPESAALLSAAILSLQPDSSVTLLSTPAGIDKARAEVCRELSHVPRYTAILSFSEIATIVVMNEAARNGWDIPRSMSLFSFQQENWMRVREPHLDSIVKPTDELAKRSVELLFSRMENFDRPTTRILVPAAMSLTKSISRALG